MKLHGLETSASHSVDCAV